MGIGSRIAFVLFALFVSAFAHAFFARWLMRAFELGKRPAVVLAIVLTSLAPLGRLLATFTHAGPVVLLQTVALLELFGMTLALVPLILVEIFVGTTLRVASRDPAERSEVAQLNRRQMLEKSGGLLVYGATATAFGWGSVKSRHDFQIEELVVKIPGLPRILDGYTIAQISDVHTGTFVKEDELKAGFEFVNRLNADMIVATGDIVDSYSEYAKMFARLFADLKSRDGSFAILGNHDYYSGARAVSEALRNAGVKLLVNEGKMIRANDGGGFGLLGVDDLWATRVGGEGPDLERAISMVRADRPKILLAHQPKYFDRVFGRVQLQLSGHTHGGQINPGFRPADLLMHYVSGKYERDGTTLWVNRGFGVAGPPVRLCAPPEVTKIVLIS